MSSWFPTTVPATPGIIDATGIATRANTAGIATSSSAVITGQHDMTAMIAAIAEIRAS